MAEPAVRADLLALTRQSLEDLANRGLVKRATREVESGKGPTLTQGEDGTVTGAIDDIVTVLQLGVGLEDTECNCGASGICRHRLAVVLAYQSQHGDGPSDRSEQDDSAAGAVGPKAEQETPAIETASFVVWSPGDFGDELLTEQFGKSAVTAANRQRRSARLATVRRPTIDDPVPTVELENATIRFLVPNDLNYVSSSTHGRDAAPAIILAVWAFRKADADTPTGNEVTLDIAVASENGPQLASLVTATLFADELLLNGTANANDVGLTAGRVRRGLEDEKLRWPLGAFDELVEQLHEYRNRGARYAASTVADLIGELHARHRSASTTSATPHARILGTSEAADASMRHLRLDGLGCRITGRPEDRQIDIFFAHADATVVYVIRRRDQFPDPDSIPTPDAYLGRTGAARTTLRTLASSNIITSAATRTANREVRIGRSTVAQTSVVPSGAAWEKMPEPLRVTDLAKLTATMAERPPRLIRARVLAESMHAIQVAQVLDVAYRPGAQTLQAMIQDPSGNDALVQLDHHALRPGALDALNDGLQSPDLRFISGFVRATGTRATIEPIGVGTDRLIALDVAADVGSALPSGRAASVRSPHDAAIIAARDVLADGVHRGLRHVAPSYHDRARRSAASLKRVGLTTSAGALTTFVDRLDQFRSDGASHDLTTAWVDAQIRLTVASSAASAPVSSDGASR